MEKASGGEAGKDRAPQKGYRITPRGFFDLLFQLADIAIVQVRRPSLGSFTKTRRELGQRDLVALAKLLASGS